MSNILARLDNAASLRAASRASRRLLNCCVTRVGICCNTCDSLTTDHSEVAIAFPNADELQIRDTHWTAPIDIDLQLAPAPAQFLGKLRSLQLSSRHPVSTCHALLLRYITHRHLQVHAARSCLTSLAAADKSAADRAFHAPRRVYAWLCLCAHHLQKHPCASGKDARHLTNVALRWQLWHCCTLMHVVHRPEAHSHELRAPLCTGHHLSLLSYSFKLQAVDAAH
jgi:hypothetical protein